MTESSPPVQLDSVQQAVWDNIALSISSLQQHKASPQTSPVSTSASSGFWGKLFSGSAMGGTAQPTKPKSVYLWGDVGRGKTVLMRRFAEAIERAQIIHFHDFMKQIHGYLHQFRNKNEPVFWATRQIAQQYDVICLDEFLVSDITDAMILSKILTFLEQHRVFLFTTSNFAPQDLYKNGLQRSQFLPAIAHIETEFTVLHLDHDTDYRYREINQQQRYWIGEKGQQTFREICQQSCPSMANSTISIQSREIHISGQYIPGNQASDNDKKAVWMRFETLCATSRSQLDYIELCEKYDQLYLENIPVMTDEQRDITRRFMMLIDVLYDKSIELYASADAPIHQLYSGKHWRFEFDRTESRLQEMT